MPGRRRTLRPIKVVLLPILGRPCIVELEDELAVVQAAVGGYIESITMEEGLKLFFDEEGKAKQLLPNHFATALARRRGALGLPIVGPALLVRHDAMGRGVDVTEADLQLALAA